MTTITYTSKRRHKPDIVGPELAPSMAYTNWTAARNAVLSNDANGNLKVAYSDTENPSAYITLTVENGALYRVRITSVADGTAINPRFEVSGYTHRIISRSGNPDDATDSSDSYILSISTSITVEIMCATETAGAYALFGEVSVRKVLQLGHSEIDANPNPHLLIQGMWTTQNATATYFVQLWNSGQKNDEGLKLVNSGAVYGQNRLAVPTISGRKYRAQVFAFPQDTQTASLLVGTTAGGSEIGSVSLTADMNSIITPASGLSWDFTNTANGWQLMNATGATGSTYYTITSTSTDPYIYRSDLSFSGYDNRYVAIKLRTTSAPQANDGLYYGTTSHGFSSSYRAYPAMSLVTTEWTLFVYDMWQIYAGGDDWKNSTITQLRFDPVTASGVSVDIDWVAVGTVNHLELEFVATGSTTHITLKNGNVNNGTCYWYMPRVIQIDSDYSLSNDMTRLDQAYNATAHRQVSISGAVETVFHNEAEIWTATTTTIQGKDSLADWLEFMSSCAGGEQFVVDINDDGDDKNALLEPGSTSVERVGGDNYRVTFSFRVID